MAHNKCVSDHLERHIKFMTVSFDFMTFSSEITNYGIICA